MAKRERRKIESEKIGRPPKPLRPPIPDTAENIMKAMVKTPPKQRRDWDYLKKKD